jgi:Uma2 family endonuclease
MVLMPVMPRESKDWTVADLEHVPDDGLQYELLDGILLVSPSPVPQHQWVVSRLFLRLESARPPGLEIYLAPIDWQPDDRTSLQPDLLVVDAADVRGTEPITAPLLLAVEVLSPSTRRKDLVSKRSKYQDAGVASYWMVDPDPQKPNIVVCELRAGRYVETGTASGDDEISLDLPFRVTLQPSALVRH